MSENKNEYYLRVDDNIVDLSVLENNRRMTNFLNLCFFTSIFKGKGELISALIGMGLLHSSIHGDVCIVKSVVDGQGNVAYVEVKSPLVYKNANALLSVEAIKRFLFQNRNQYEAIRSILETVRRELSDLLCVFDRKIETLRKLSSMMDGEELEDMYLRIERQNASRRSFRLSLDNIAAIFNLLDDLQDKSRPFSRYKDIEYGERLDRFVTEEVYYQGERKTSLNERGLIKLALIVTDARREFALTGTPFFSQLHHDIRSEYMRAVKRLIDSHCISSNPSSVSIVEEIEGDPDSFMFLEEDDFRLPEFPTDAERESHEDSIEALRFKKRGVTSCKTM